jgi:hypothetical protein
VINAPVSIALIGTKSENRSYGVGVGVGVGVGGGRNGRQLPATVVVCMTEPAEEPAVRPGEGVVLAAADDVLELLGLTRAALLVVPLGLAFGVGLPVASGAGTILGEVEQVFTTVVIGAGVVFPTGAAIPLVAPVKPGVTVLVDGGAA